MRVLLLEDRDDEFRDKIKFALEGTYGAKVAEARSHTEGVEALQKPRPGEADSGDGDDGTAAPNAGSAKKARPSAAPVTPPPPSGGKPYDLIVYDLASASRSELQTFLEANTAGVPLVLCASAAVTKSSDSHSYLDPNIVGTIPRETLIDSLLGLVDSLIEDKRLSVPETDPLYCRIRSRLLLELAPLHTDVYIRLSEWKFVRLFAKGDKFERSDWEKYTNKKGVEYLYLKTEETDKLVKKYTQDIKQTLAQTPLPVETVLRSNELAHETVRELGRKVGFTRDVQELAKAQVELTQRSVGRSPKLAEILKKMSASKGEYIAAHSTMAAYFSCAIASKLEWASDITYHKLNLAAFLHDVTLHNHDLAACETIVEVTAPEKKFKKDEIEAFKKHPVLGAEIAKRFTEVPADVDTIILQHHERPDASGFPRGLGQTYIAPLTAVFIIAHELTRAVLTEGPLFDYTAFLAHERGKYPSGQFRKILTAMEQLG